LVESPGSVPSIRQHQAHAQAAAVAVEQRDPTAVRLGDLARERKE
jgi:hypothetical protein